MARNLSGKTALVTGASAGIGRATVATLIGHGANVIATGRRQDALEALVAEHGARRVTAIAGDLNDGDFVADLVPAAADVDILVSNAGVLKYAPILDLTYDDMEDMVRTNVLGSFRITHEIAKAMVERGRGHIVVMTSTAAREVYPLGSIYCATKHALSAFARALRIELQAKGIQVSEIAPGMVDTDIRNNSDHPAVLAAVSARKFEPLTPEEVAEAVGFALLSSDNCANDLIELRPRGAAA
jgi:3-hydroxy acid dehydrogenase/malonic semialdehyde reductase